jgi:hypothetical protein
VAELAEARTHGAHGPCECNLGEGVAVEADEPEAARGQVAGEGRLAGARLVTGVAERDPAGCDAPPLEMVGLDALQLDAADLECDAVAGTRQHPVDPVAELEQRHAVAGQRRDFPHHVLPLAVLQRDVVRALPAVAVGQPDRAVVVQHDLQRQHREPGDVRAHPHRDAVVPAPVLAVERAAQVDRGEPAPRRRRRVREHGHVHAQHAHPVEARCRGERQGAGALECPCARVAHVVEEPRVHHGLLQPAELRGVLELDGQQGTRRLRAGGYAHAGGQAQPEERCSSRCHCGTTRLRDHRWCVPRQDSEGRPWPLRRRWWARRRPAQDAASVELRPVVVFVLDGQHQQ